MLGGAVFGPVLHCWYRWLDAALPGAAARTVAAKVALDLAVFALPYYAAFYLGLNLLAGVALKVGLSLVHKLQTDGHVRAGVHGRAEAEAGADHRHHHRLLGAGPDHQLQARHCWMVRRSLIIILPPCCRYVPPKYRVVYLAGCTFVEFNILALFKKWKFEN